MSSTKFQIGELVITKIKGAHHGPKKGYGVVLRACPEGISREGPSMRDDQDRTHWVNSCFESICHIHNVQSTIP